MSHKDTSTTFRPIKEVREEQMSFTLCSSGAIVIKAGVDVSTSAATSAAILEQFSNEAEGRLIAETRYDWIANIAKVKTNFKPVLADATSAYAAGMLISYDMSGYVNRGYAEDLINMNMDRFQKAVKFLIEDKNKTAMGADNQ